MKGRYILRLAIKIMVIVFFCSQILIADQLKKKEMVKKKGVFNGQSIEYVDGEIIIGMKLRSSQEKEATLKKILFKYDAKIIKKFPLTDAYLLQLPEEKDPIKVAVDVESSFDIKYAEPNAVGYETTVQPNDARYQDQWALPLINAPKGWQRNTGSFNTIIAIMDSGIHLVGGEPTHEDLLEEKVILLGLNPPGGDERDHRGHGTHVAGIASAITNNSLGIAGVSWGSRLMPVKVGDDEGNYSSAWLKEGIENVVGAVAIGKAFGAKIGLVINVSLCFLTRSESLAEAIQTAGNLNATYT